MKKLYLTQLQIISLLIPLLVALYFFSEPKQVLKIADFFEKRQELFVFDISKLEEMPVNNAEYTLVMQNYLNSQFSFYEREKEMFKWAIVSMYEDTQVSETEQEQPIVTTKRAALEDLEKYARLVQNANFKYESAQAANYMLHEYQENENESLLKPADKSTLPESLWEDYEDIVNGIKARGFSFNSKIKETYTIKNDSIRSSDYKLQMVLYSQTSPEVIIGNRIYGLNSNIDGFNTQIVKIEQDKVLIKRGVETKWLKLID